MVSFPLRTQLISSISDRLSIAESPQHTKYHNASTAWQPLALPDTPLFGTDGIRSRVGELLNESLALQVGFWAGKVLQNQAATNGPIIIGQDPRNSSDMLAQAVASGLTATGLEVWNLGLCPTPCVAYLTGVSEAIGGVMISASHNPPEDNGIKFFGADGMKLPSALQKQIEAGLREKNNITILNATWGKQFQRPELINSYLDSLYNSLLSPIDLSGMRIVLDLAWGAAVHTAPAIFKALGAEVICLHDQPDGDRINVNCGSTHLHSLQETVKFQCADVGFAFDGDADRVMAVDSLGRVIDGDYILYFWGQDLRQNNQLPKDLIIATVMANLGFERAWQKLGGKLVRTAVGDQYVQAEMQSSGAMLGGEQSGHILCHHYSASGDGLLSALHLTALIKRSGMTLTQMREQSFQTYPQILRNVRVEDRERRLNWQNCEPLQKAIASAEADMGDKGRILVRASGTEPVIRVMVEAVTPEITNHWTEQLVQTVNQFLAV